MKATARETDAELLRVYTLTGREHPLPLLGPADRAGIVGITGQGKSALTKEHVRRELAAGRRVLVLDYHDEYSRHGKPTKQVRLGPLRDRCTVDELIEKNGHQLLEPKLSLAVALDKSSPEAAAEDVTITLGFVEEAGNMLVALDEVGEYGEHCLPALRSLATNGRHWGADGTAAIYCSQRMVDLHPKVRSQFGHLISFHQNLEPDLDGIAERTRSKAFAERVVRLEPGEYMHWRASNLPSPSPEGRK